jgi:hypothetical protein
MRDLGINIEAPGLEQAYRKIAWLESELMGKREWNRVIKAGCQRVVDISRAFYVPVLTGELQRSIHVEKRTNEGYAIVFGDNASAPYAMVQHEDLWYDRSIGQLVPRHLHHLRGESKFVEKPLLLELPRIEQELIDAFRAGLELDKSSKGPAPSAVMPSENVGEVW